MKKLFLLCVLVTSFSYSQIIDENGTIATGQSNTQLTGKIGIGISSPQVELDVLGEVNSEKMIIEPSSITTDGYLFQIGNNVLNGNRFFNFHFYDQYDAISETCYDQNGKVRKDFWASDNQTYLTLKNTNQSEIFKVSRDDAYGSYIQMPKSNSRIVIGGLVSHLFNEGHKLVVKNGSAMIEGNILTDSNIGIGTDSFVDGTDTYRLSVYGKVRAHEIKVYTTWADYVFESNYKLPTLTEVENYIKEKGHLIDIPSAKEVEENGIKLGEMNKLLLQKIEELTLYTIEQQKMIKQLQQEVAIIKVKNN